MRAHAHQVLYEDAASANSGQALSVISEAQHVDRAERQESMIDSQTSGGRRIASGACRVVQEIRSSEWLKFAYGDL